MLEIAEKELYNEDNLNEDHSIVGNNGKALA